MNMDKAERKATGRVAAGWRSRRKAPLGVGTCGS